MLKTKCETVNKWGETIVKKTLFYLSLKEFRKRLQSGSTWCYHLAQKHIVNFRRECQQNFKQILRRKCLFTVYENSHMDSEEGKNIMGSRLIKALSEIEELAEEIMADKEQIKNLDLRRNTNREALNALKKIKGETSSNKSWMCLGGMFIKYPSANISEILLKDQEELETEIKNIRDGLKTKVSKLHQMEGTECPKGFDLTALDKEELSTFTATKR